MSAAKENAFEAMSEFVEKVVDSLKPAYSETLTISASSEETIQLNTIIDNIGQKNPLDIQITVSKLNSESGDPMNNFYVLNPTDILVGKNNTSVKIRNTGSSDAMVHVVISQIFK